MRLTTSSGARLTCCAGPTAWGWSVSAMPGGNGFRQTQDFAPLIELARRGELSIRNRYRFARPPRPESRDRPV